MTDSLTRGDVSDFILCVLRAPSPGGDAWVGLGQSPGSTPPHHLALDPPTPTCLYFPPHVGLTSFLRRLGLHLLGFLVLDGAQRQHHGTTGPPCGQETEHLVPGRWSRGARVWLSELGWTQTAPSPPMSPGPQHPRGRAGNASCWFPPRPRV